MHLGRDPRIDALERREHRTPVSGGQRGCAEQPLYVGAQPSGRGVRSAGLASGRGGPDCSYIGAKGGGVAAGERGAPGSTAASGERDPSRNQARKSALHKT